MEAFVKLSSKAGWHGRPGALLVELARKNPHSKIFLEKEGKRILANSILNLLALGAQKGEVVKVIIEGEDEKKIFLEVQKILKGTKL